MRHCHILQLQSSMRQAAAGEIEISSEYESLFTIFRPYELHEIKSKGSETESGVILRAGCTLSGR